MNELIGTENPHLTVLGGAQKSWTSTHHSAGKSTPVKPKLGFAQTTRPKTHGLARKTRLKI
ncbi:hypothetical protein, partial [Salmonella enterica]|uniref:hypothetical protein n=1 Tax=Salmonella enterica TaxID=28901 RepID=UPI003296ABC8